MHQLHIRALAYDEGKGPEQAHLGIDILDRFLVGGRGDGGFRLLETLYSHKSRVS